MGEASRSERMEKMNADEAQKSSLEDNAKIVTIFCRV